MIIYSNYELSNRILLFIVFIRLLLFSFFLLPDYEMFSERKEYIEQWSRFVKTCASMIMIGNTVFKKKEERNKWMSRWEFKNEYIIDGKVEQKRKVTGIESVISNEIRCSTSNQT